MRRIVLRPGEVAIRRLRRPTPANDLGELIKAVHELRDAIRGVSPQPTRIEAAFLEANQRLQIARGHLPERLSDLATIDPDMRAQALAALDEARSAEVALKTIKREMP
jgi:hypothetical protein